MGRRRHHLTERQHALLTCLLIVVVYFIVPLRPDVSPLRLLLRGVATGLVVLAIGLLVTRQVRRQLGRQQRQGRGDDLLRLVVALVAGLIIFAFADYVIQLSDPRQFDGLRTRVDALYFALATLTTIGYGDVTAQGQFARITVIVQMLFDVAVVATGASLLFRETRERYGK